MAPIPTLSLPVDENDGALVFKDPMGSFRLMPCSPFSEPGSDAFLNTILTKSTL